jgi:hypothetical protein
MSSILYSVQQEIASALLADPFFAGVPVLVEVPRDLSFELQASAAAAGTWGVVLVPQAQVSAPNAPGPIFDPVEFAVRFRQNVPVAAGPCALEAAETALALLHLYKPASVNEVLVAATEALRRVVEPNVVTYEVRVRTQVCAAYAVPQVGLPVVACAGVQSPQTVSLSCATAGAAIFYTLDGSAPVPRGATASLYSAPFTVSAAGMLRVRAWLAGYLASGEAREVFL